MSVDLQLCLLLQLLELSYMYENCQMKMSDRFRSDSRIHQHNLWPKQTSFWFNIPNWDSHQCISVGMAFQTLITPDLPCRYSNRLPLRMSSVTINIGSSWVHTAYSWMSLPCRSFFMMAASARKSLGSMVPGQWHNNRTIKLKVNCAYTKYCVSYI